MDLGKEDINSKQIEPSPGVLYVVGTPIGNMGDLSPRAKNLLSKVSFIACEDTRRSGQLLKRFNIKAKLISFFQHNVHSKLDPLVDLLSKSHSLALISDAGLPGISDPGYELISRAKDKGFKVICIPGPCAAISALVTSGLPSQRFCFEGFLPSKQKDRNSILKIIAQEVRTTIIYESPHRLLKLLEELSNACGRDRPLEVLRELTKIHEEQIGSTIGDVLNHFLKIKPKGEFTLVLGGIEKKNFEKIDEKTLIDQMGKLIEGGMTTSNAARELSKKTRYPKNFLYSLIHQNNNNNS